MKCKNKGNGNSQKMQKLYFTFECLVEVQNSNFMQYIFFLPEVQSTEAVSVTTLQCHQQVLLLLSS